MTQTLCLPAEALPFLTVPDPLVSGEGALDPLGLAVVGDRLADWILPGLTVASSRPRFLTAIAVAAKVCDGMEEVIAACGMTPAYLVFEWLLVEGLARAPDGTDVHGTPGIGKASACRRAGTPMLASIYLKAPTVFGYHGVYSA